MHNDLKVEKKVQMFGHSVLDNAPKCQAGLVLPKYFGFTFQKITPFPSFSSLCIRCVFCFE